MLRQIYEAFLADAPETIHRLSEALSRGDPVAIRESAHRLKGGSLNVGADRMAKTAQRLEIMGRDGVTEGGDADLGVLLEELSRLEKELAPEAA